MVNKLIDTKYQEKNLRDPSLCQFFVNFYDSNGVRKTILSGRYIPCNLLGQHVEIVKKGLEQKTIADSSWEYNNVLFGDFPETPKNPQIPETPEIPATPGTEQTFIKKYGLYIGIGIVVLIILIR